MPGRAVVRPTFLVDGFVRGTWAVDGCAVHVDPFRVLGPAEAAAVEDEAQRLSAFLALEHARAH